MTAFGASNTRTPCPCPIFRRALVAASATTVRAARGAAWGPCPQLRLGTLHSQHCPAVSRVLWLRQPGSEGRQDLASRAVVAEARAAANVHPPIRRRHRIGVHEGGGSDHAGEIDNDLCLLSSLVPVGRGWGEGPSQRVRYQRPRFPQADEGCLSYSGCARRKRTIHTCLLNQQCLALTLHLPEQNIPLRHVPTTSKALSFVFFGRWDNMRTDA